MPWNGRVCVVSDYLSLSPPGQRRCLKPGQRQLFLFNTFVCVSSSCLEYKLEFTPPTKNKESKLPKWPDRLMTAYDTEATVIFIIGYFPCLIIPF